MEIDPHLCVRFAASSEDLRASQRLRYECFVAELGGSGAGVDHENRIEADDFDRHCDHLILVDDRRCDPVVGVYRLLTGDGAKAAGGFYCENEFDLAPLLMNDRKVLELGRSCLHPDYRGGTAMFVLWQALARHVVATGVDLLFGAASFHGTDTGALAQPLSFLQRNHLAPPEIRVQTLDRGAQNMTILPDNQIDRRAAMLATPALIKAYLRMGGFVGEGVYVDHAFNTTDVLLVMETARINARQRRIYGTPV